MAELIQKHYGKLVAAAIAWSVEALFDLSAFIKALLP